MTVQAPAFASVVASSREAKALFTKVIESLGGPARVIEVKNVREKGTMISKGPMGEQTVDFESWSWVNPADRQRQALTMNGMAISRVLTPEAAFMSTPMGVQDMPPSQKEQAMRELKMGGIQRCSNGPRNSGVCRAADVFWGHPLWAPFAIGLERATRAAPTSRPCFSAVACSLEPIHDD